MNKIKLLPCPFCGNSAVIVERGRGFWAGYCPMCDISGEVRNDRQKAADRWNRREEAKSENNPNSGR